MASNVRDNKPEDFNDLPVAEQQALLVNLISSQIEGVEPRLALAAVNQVMTALFDGMPTTTTADMLGLALHTARNVRTLLEPLQVLNGDQETLDDTRDAANILYSGILELHYLLGLRKRP